MQVTIEIKLDELLDEGLWGQTIESILREMAAEEIQKNVKKSAEYKAYIANQTVLALKKITESGGE